MVTGAVGISISLMVVIAAGFIVAAVFGPQYEDTVSVLRILYLTISSLYLGYVSTFIAIALHLEKRVMSIMLTCVIIKVLLNSVSIPLWGPHGAAWTAVISETLLTVWLLWVLFQKIRALPSKVVVESSNIVSFEPNAIANGIACKGMPIDHETTF